MLYVPRFIVIGGAETGLFYVRQLLRAVAAGRLRTDSVVVVDRDPGCAVSRLDDGRVRVDVSDWAEWLDQSLAGCDPREHLVPYHWAPHLLVAWLQRELERQGGRTERGGPVGVLGVPYEADTSQGDRALSYATWICPPTCVEPDVCPHTRGPRDWSLAADLERPAAEGTHEGRVVFRCLHLVWGVGTIPVGEIQAARDRLLSQPGAARQRYRVATSSHCHALATALTVWR